MVGRITSGMFGHTIGAAVGLGYVTNEGGLVTPDFIAAGRFEIEIAGTRVPAWATLKPFYDPAGWRLRDVAAEDAPIRAA